MGCIRCERIQGVARPYYRILHAREQQWALLESESGGLWLMTRGSVVRRLHDHFEVLTPQQGIPYDYLLDLVEDHQGHFWLPGLRGIHRLIRSELEACLEGRLARVQSLTLGVRDGLLTSECTTLHYPISARTPDGHIWVATRAGVASFDPARVQVEDHPLPVAIEQVSARQHIFADPLRQPSVTPLRLPPAPAKGSSSTSPRSAWSRRIGSGSVTGSRATTRTGQRRAICAWGITPTRVRAPTSSRSRPRTRTVCGTMRQLRWR